MPTTPEASSAAAPSTSASADSSDAQEPNAPTTSTTSWTRAIGNINLEKLSPSSRATKILIADALSDGYQISEIATSLGQPPSWVSQRLNELRNELLLASGHFFPLSEHEYQALEQSILEHGIQVEVLLGRHIPLIDGRHRLLIANEHRLEVPCRLLDGLSADEEHDLAVALNAARRQLSRAQKRELVSAELMRNPARSDRYIGSICGVHGETVASVRREIAAQQEDERQASLPKTGITEWPGEEATANGPKTRATEWPGTTTTVQPTTRAGRDGSTRSAPEPHPAGPRALPPPIGHANCAHGQRHAIYRDGAGYRLESR